MERRDIFSGLWSDLRVSMRALVRSPAFALTVIATLALCIGATTAIFSLVDAILLRPLRFAEPERLVRAYVTSPENGIARSPVSTPVLAAWRARDRDFESLSGFFFTEGMTGIDL